MARTFRRYRPLHAQSELNITNLLDLAFVLLIIFMIASPFITPEQTHPVNLPVEPASVQVDGSPDTRFVTVTVRADGSYLIDADGNRPLSARDLPGRLMAVAASAGARDQPVIRIRADASVPYQNIITLMAELKKAGLARVSFDTQVQG